MPKLPKKYIRIHCNTTGHDFGVAIEPSVSSDGIFRCEPPAMLLETLRLTTKPHNWEGTRNGDVLRAFSLGDLCDIVKVALEHYHEAEETSELVIRYSLSLNIAFCVGESGAISPNGERSGGSNNEARKWWKPKSTSRFAHRTERFSSVGIAAIVMKRVTVKRKIGTIIRMEIPTNEELEEAGLPDAANLNRWSGNWDLHPGPEAGSGIYEIPYRNDVAVFLANTLLGFAKLALALDEIFQTPARLSEVVQSGQSAAALPWNGGSDAAE